MQPAFQCKIQLLVLPTLMDYWILNCGNQRCNLESFYWEFTPFDESGISLPDEKSFFGWVGNTVSHTNINLQKKK